MAIPATKSSLGIFRQYIASMTAALSMLSVGMATAWPSPVLPKIMELQEPVAMDRTQISWMVSLMFLGNTISPLPSGWLMDKLGRKRTMYILNVLPFCGWMLTLFCQFRWMLYLARFLIGLWAGTSYTVCAIYIGEIADPSIRGSLSNFNNLFRSAGALFVFVVGPYVSYESLALVCSTVPTLFFLVGIFIPESPYFLLMMNKRPEAKKSLKWLRGRKDKTALECELQNMENAVVVQTQSKGSFKEIFVDRANRRAFTIVTMLAFVKNLSGMDVMLAYTSITLPKEAFESLGPNECVIILGVITVVTCVGSIFMLDRFPRRNLLAISSLGCAITTLSVGVWFFLDEKTSINVKYLSQLPFYCFAIHVVVYSIGLGPVIASVKGELFSANVKGLCSALSSITFAVLGFVTTNIYLIVAAFLGMYANYFMYSICCAIGTVFILVYSVETRGKTLQEIQTKLSEKKKSVKLSVIAN